MKLFFNLYIWLVRDRAIGSDSDETFFGKFVVQRPNEQFIAAWYCYGFDARSIEKTEFTFWSCLRKKWQGLSAREKKHQPMACVFIIFLGNTREEVKIAFIDDKAGFFMCFTYGAFKGGLACANVQLSANGTPLLAIGWFASVQQ